MTRRLLNLLTALSLLLCVAVVGLWVRSNGGRVGKLLVSFNLRGNDYTIESNHRRVTLVGPPVVRRDARPRHGLRTEADLAAFASGSAGNWSQWDATLPPPAPPLANRTLGELVNAIRNDQIEWWVYYRRVVPRAEPDDDGVRDLRLAVARFAGVEVHAGTPANLFCEQEYPMGVAVRSVYEDPPVFTPEEMRPALLEALDYPDRFVAAHVLLARLENRRLDASRFEPRPDGVAVVDVSGLRVELLPPPPNWEYNFDRTFYGGGEGIDSDCRVRVDPAQRLALRDQWHRKYRGPVFGATYPVLTGITAAVPLFWVTGAAARLWQRWRRRREVVCVTCGYDLIPSVKPAIAIVCDDPLAQQQPTPRP
jgi:hypothetical protein